MTWMLRLIVLSAVRVVSREASCCGDSVVGGDGHPHGCSRVSARVGVRTCYWSRLVTITITDLSSVLSRILDRINFDGPPPSDPATPITSGCWVWGGGTFPAGYGSCWLDGKNRLVHQVIFEAATGERSDRSKYLDHLCRVPRCCNPEHINLGTPLDNMLSAQRPFCVNGHEYTEENTARSGRTEHQRVCRECSRQKAARYRARKATQ
jgi:hypothetical protein